VLLGIKSVRIDPRTLLTQITRAQFAALPLRFIVTPVLNGPTLVFSEKDQGRAEVFSSDIDLTRELLPRSRNREVIKRLSRAARVAHEKRVAMAVGYTWPGNPPGHIEFADDA
jgi:hypothetical protein